MYLVTVSKKNFSFLDIKIIIIEDLTKKHSLFLLSVFYATIVPIYLKTLR